jgi:uroporphyrinogen-III synthase
VEVLPVYETKPDTDGVELLRAALAEDRVDVVTFTASSTVKSVVSTVSPEELRNATIACIGPITAETARNAGLNVQVSARIHSMAGLVQALEDFFTISP